MKEELDRSTLREIASVRRAMKPERLARSPFPTKVGATDARNGRSQNESN